MDADKKPLTNIALAKAIGVGVTYVQAMIKVGFTRRYGRRGTLADALKWMEEHPDFVEADAYPRSRSKTHSKRSNTVSALPV